jgi:hypothetical protein
MALSLQARMLARMQTRRDLAGSAQRSGCRGARAGSRPPAGSGLPGGQDLGGLRD